MDDDRNVIGVITVRGPDYHPTRRLAEAAHQRGGRIVPIHPYQVWPTILNGRPSLASRATLEPLNAVIPRQGAEIRDACLPLITHFEQMSIPVVNNKRAIELVRNKFFALQALATAQFPVPDTVFISASDGLEAVWHQLNSSIAVVKQVSGRQGSGVHLLEKGKGLTDVLTIELELGRGLLCQRFIPPQGRQDLRVLVVGGRVVCAMALTPPDGEFRANYHLGAGARAITPSAEIETLVLQAVKRLDLQIAGVDLMIDEHGKAVIIEVNYAPGFRGLEEITGQDVAGAIIDYVLGLIKDEGVRMKV